MAKENKPKRNGIQNKVALIITIIGLIVISVGTSYAVLKGNSESLKEQVIRTGNVTLKLTEHFENIDKVLEPKKDSEGLIQEEVYEFNIKNIGSVAAKYDLKLITEVDGKEKIEDKYIKIGLEVNNEEYGPMSIEEVEQVIDSNVIYKEEIINYKLRIWLDESITENKDLEGYKVKIKIGVEAEQRVDNEYPLITNVIKGKVGENKEVKKIEQPQTEQLKAVTEYRYRGREVNNYIEFNNEMWRVIGVFLVEDEEGEYRERVKIIKDEHLEKPLVWNDGEATWENASLNEYLNGEYFNSMDKHYSKLIMTSKYYLASGTYNYSTATSDILYKNERGNIGPTGHALNTFSKIALMYTTDYGYAGDSTCTDTIVYYYGFRSNCYINDWLFPEKYINEETIEEALLDKFGDVNNIDNARLSINTISYGVAKDGYKSKGTASDTSGCHNEFLIRPVLYLDESTLLKKGTGQKDDPYVLYIK